MTKHQLTEKDISKKVNVSHLEFTSRSCYKQWKSLPPILGLQSSVIDKTPKDEKIKCFSFLLSWMTTKGSGATHKQLLTALLKINCEEAAEMLCTRIKKSASDSLRPRSLTATSPTSGGTFDGAPNLPPRPKTGTYYTILNSTTKNVPDPS